MVACNKVNLPDNFSIKGIRVVFWITGLVGFGPTIQESTNVLELD